MRRHRSREGAAFRKENILHDKYQEITVPPRRGAVSPTFRSNPYPPKRQAAYRHDRAQDGPLCG